jgi:hypothetical protein
VVPPKPQGPLKAEWTDDADGKEQNKKNNKKNKKTKKQKNKKMLMARRRKPGSCTGSYSIPANPTPKR